MITASKLTTAIALVDSPYLKIEKMCIKIETTVSTTATASTIGQKRDLGPVDPVVPPPGPPPPTSPADIGWFNSDTYRS